LDGGGGAASEDGAGEGGEGLTTGDGVGHGKKLGMETSCGKPDYKPGRGSKSIE
jgi:hypothetical protein